jgi:hypothetical protein
VKRRCAPAALLAVFISFAAAGCGSSSLSSAQLRSRATQACDLTNRRLGQIPTPQVPGAGAAFLSRGVAALRPELAALERLHAGGAAADPYSRALAASDQELKALQSSLKGLKAGNDPVVAIKTLQQQLAPLEARGIAAWRALGIPACGET